MSTSSFLAESALHTARFLEEINDAPQHFHYVPGECGHISLFTRFQPSLFPAILESHRISIRRLDLPARAKVTVVSAHLPSKMPSATTTRSSNRPHSEVIDHPHIAVPRLRVEGQVLTVGRRQRRHHPLWTAAVQQLLYFTL